MKKKKYYYPDSKQIHCEGYVNKNDKQEGKWTWYYKSGEIEYIGHFKNDKQEGKWTWYYKSGEIECKGHNKDGEYFTEKEWQTYKNLELILQ